MKDRKARPVALTTAPESIYRSTSYFKVRGQGQGHWSKTAIFSEKEF